MTAPITSKCCAATARLTPSISISHGTDQSPARHERPMPNPPSGAIHQNAGCRRHAARRPLRAKAGAVAGRGVSGMENQIHTAPPSSRGEDDEDRPPVAWRSAISSGAVAASAPTLRRP